MTNSLTTEQRAEQWQMLAFHARSFRWAAAFLRPGHRERVAALYAFCRAVDDLADSEWVTEESRRDLDQICDALDAELEGRDAWPPNYFWFRGLCVESGIDFRVVRELMAGMKSDLATVRMQSDRELLRYCYRAAGTVGLMMCSVFGVRDPRAQRHAIDLGIAMQLTNICRDVMEDAESARVYLPAERLTVYGVEPSDLVSGTIDPDGVSLVVSELIEMSECYYRSGDSGMTYLPRRARLAVLIASRLYRGIGRRLRAKQDCNPFIGRVVVPWYAKLRLVAAATVSWVRLSWRSRRSRRPNGPNQLHSHLEGLPYTASAKPRKTPSLPPPNSTGKPPSPEVNPVGHAVGHPH
ncbi:MAG: phytoene/squalene synthase family protein [Myxococcota bacterium]